MQFELLISAGEGEKLALALSRNAKKIGVTVNVRPVDDAQIQQRRQTFDYDLIMGAYSASLSPGIEQVGRWGSKSANEQGSNNYAGVASPAIDAMISAMVSARDRGEFVDTVRALDRLLISGNYLIPTQFKPDQWVAYWKEFKHPDYTPVYGYQLNTWWTEL